MQTTAIYNRNTRVAASPAGSGAPAGQASWGGAAAIAAAALVFDS